MSIYAIGDVHGCYDDLLRLLHVIKFDAQNDQLWFTGDLVNRGHQSLETLRFVKSLGNRAVTVLGNHDLHLIATALYPQYAHKKDTFNAILHAADGDELLHWLRHRPLFHAHNDFCLLHAGLPPQWNFAQTQKMALAAENMLQGPTYKTFFKVLYGNKPKQWSPALQSMHNQDMDKIRFIINCFTRIRYCDADGRLDFEHKGRLGSQPSHLMPWFKVPQRQSEGMNIIFGHWSTLGYYQQHNCYAIDTGCFWKGQLTALKLGECVQRISIDCAGVELP